jgi:hypothetical protein
LHPDQSSTRQIRGQAFDWRFVSDRIDELLGPRLDEGSDGVPPDVFGSRPQGSINRQTFSEPARRAPINRCKFLFCVSGQYAGPFAGREILTVLTAGIFARQRTCFLVIQAESQKG